MFYGEMDSQNNVYNASRVHKVHMHKKHTFAIVCSWTLLCNWNVNITRLTVFIQFLLCFHTAASRRTNQLKFTFTSNQSTTQNRRYTMCVLVLLFTNNFIQHKEWAHRKTPFVNYFHTSTVSNFVFYIKQIQVHLDLVKIDIILKFLSLQ